MSIAGAVQAEMANKQREAWLAELDAAIAAEDWSRVKALAESMRTFRFSE